MEIEIISRENIKPSSPTPSHLRNYKLSLLDQLSMPVYVAKLLFYSPNSTDNHLTPREKVEMLKESLSKTLSHYYPLAGKINDKLSVDCNDEGAYFVEARVKACMTDSFLKQRNPALFSRFLPPVSMFIDVNSRQHVSMFQVNVFDCGGIVIGILVPHMVADGKAISTFLKCWASFANSGDSESETDQSLFPSYISSSLFPQNDTISLEDTIVGTLSPFEKKAKWVTKRFTFDVDSLSALKAKVTKLCNGHMIPTRVQSVTALIWKSFIAMRTSLSAHGAQKPSLVTHSMDFRRRASPPFSESSMGNFVWPTWAKCKDTEWDQLVGEINKAIKKVDAEFVKQIEGESGVFKYREALKELREEANKEAADFLMFTSWFNFGLYKVDFGWGKPALATCSGFDGESVYINVVILMEAKDDGMEAWVTLDEKEMAIFESQRELMSFVSVDRS